MNLVEYNNIIFIREKCLLFFIKLFFFTKLKDVPPLFFGGGGREGVCAHSGNICANIGIFPYFHQTVFSRVFLSVGLKKSPCLFIKKD